MLSRPSPSLSFSPTTAVKDSFCNSLIPGRAQSPADPATISPTRPMMRQFLSAPFVTFYRLYRVFRRPLFSFPHSFLFFLLWLAFSPGRKRIRRERDTEKGGVNCVPVTSAKRVPEFCERVEHVHGIARAHTSNLAPCYKRNFKSARFLLTSRRSWSL